MNADQWNGSGAAIPYWGPKDWTGPTAHCPSMRHRAPFLADLGVMGRHSISAGFTGRCPGMGKPPREMPWESDAESGGPR